MTETWTPHWMRCHAELRRRRACRHTWRTVLDNANRRATVLGRRFRVELGPNGWRIVEVGPCI